MWLDLIYFLLQRHLVCYTISSLPCHLPLLLVCMTGHFLGEYQLLFTPLSSHYRACYLRHSRLERRHATRSDPFPPFSISQRVINHSLKYGVNCRKLQITIFIGHARTRVHTPAGHWVIAKFSRQVVIIGFLVLRPSFRGRKDVPSRNLSGTYFEKMQFCPVAPEHFVLQNHIHYGALPPRRACPKLFDNAGTKYIVRSL